MLIDPRGLKGTARSGSSSSRASTFARASASTDANSAAVSLRAGRPSARCGARGKAWRDKTLESWCPLYNPTPQPDSSIASCSSNQVYLRRGCRQHHVSITVEGANRDAAFLHCKYCSGGSSSKKASGPEQKALPIITQLAEPWPLLTESKALGGSYGAIDFAIPQAVNGRWVWLWVEVDGKQHREESCRGVSPEQQSAIDRRKDAAAAAAGMVLVRLYCTDTEEQWQHTLGLGIEAAKAAAQQSGSGCVFYTPSYKLPTLTAAAAAAAAAAGQQ